jgi:hypothetical protein
MHHQNQGVNLEKFRHFAEKSPSKDVLRKRKLIKWNRALRGLVLDVSYQERLDEGEKSYALSFEYCARLVPKYFASADASGYPLCCR